MRFGGNTIPNPESPTPAVTISVAKRKGTNAIQIADNVIEKVSELKGTLIPSDVHVTITRNYGETAAEKSNELLFHMMIAIVSVSVLIWLTLGFRESGIVAMAIPVTLALTLAVFYLYGYTLNRVTLFALIFSIGILVDDAIVVIDAASSLGCDMIVLGAQHRRFFDATVIGTTTVRVTRHAPCPVLTVIRK